MNCESLIETLKPHLEKVGHLVIAGGAVRDQLMSRKPKDWDVFVLGQKNLEAAKCEIGLALEDCYEWDNDGSDPGQPTLTLPIEGEKVQIIPSKCGTVMELLDTFDWNICLFGWDNGEFVKHLDSMLPEEHQLHPLKLHAVSHPLSTLRRGFRFCDRYGLRIEKEEIRRLCGEVLANIITQEEEREPEEEAIELA